LPSQATSSPAASPLQDHTRLSPPLTRYDLLFFAILVASGLLHIFMRLVVSAGAELDEAEQLLLSQALAVGYTDQPPLYTWLLLVVQTFLGVNVWSLAVLKHLLLFSTYACLFLAARLALRDAALALLTALSLWLMPQIAWESVRDLTHSVLVTSVSAACLYVTLALVHAPRTRHYLVLGLLLGAGALAKYSFLVFAAAWLGAVLSHRDTRGRLCDRRLWLTVGLAGMLVLLHFLWWLGHVHLDTSPAFRKLARQDSLQPFYAIGTGVLRLIWAAVSFLTPFWVVCLLTLPGTTWGRSSALGEIRRYRELLERFFLLVFSILGAAVLLFGVTHFKDRWMQPFLFLTPLYVFLRLQGAVVLPAQLRRYAVVLAACGGAFLVAPLAQAWVAPWFGVYSRLHVPFEALAPQLERAGFRHGTIVAESTFLGGNLRLTLPQARVLTPELPMLPLTSAHEAGQCLVVWDGRQGPSLPGPVQRFLETDLRAHVPTGPPPGYVEAYLKGSSERVFGLWFMIFPGGLGGCR
jgi:4-amino-4-deoxy-L-arabinose transferase-like glycosyltransferase